MSQSNDPLAAERRRRDEALANVTKRFTRLKTGLAEKGVGERVADEAKGKAKALVKEAAEVANDSRGIIAATIGALAIWTWRKPIIAELGKLSPLLGDIWDKVITRFSKEHG